MSKRGYPHKLLIALMLFCVFQVVSATPITRFTVVDSSPTSWVARGLQNYTVTPDLGWTFLPSRNFDNGVGFEISGHALPGTTIDRWFLNFAAPFNSLLVPGLYPDFQRFPFQDDDRPGLEFGSTGRLDNRASGFFEVLEAAYSPSGEVLTFSANFTHFGEEIIDRFAIAEIRFNVAKIPEPHTVQLSVIGILLLFVSKRHAVEIERIRTPSV